MTFSYDHNKSLGYLISLARRLLSNKLAMSFHEAKIDMTTEQWGALLVLLNEGAMTQGQLGERLHLEKSSVSRLIDGLERRKRIVRTRNPQDSRQKLVTPTPKALEMAELCAAIARPILEEAQSGMAEDEILLLRSMLSRIITNLENQSDRLIP